MIISENYGGGVRWYCDRCDVTVNEHGRFMVQWTNSASPKQCDRCDEPSVMVCWHNGRPGFVSNVMTRAEATQLQRIMQEGGVYDAERGQELKRQMLERV